MSEKTSIASWKYARICLQILTKEYMFKKGGVYGYHYLSCM